jgi:hypothetical protein
MWGVIFEPFDTYHMEGLVELYILDIKSIDASVIHYYALVPRMVTYTFNLFCTGKVPI